MRHLLSLFLPLALFLVLPLPAQSPQKIPPNDLVRRVVTHELQAESNDHSHWLYQIIANVPTPAKTTTVVETTGGDLNDLLAINGQPLPPDQRSAEDRRLQSFIHDPKEQSKARRDAAEDDKKSAELFAMLPDAFIFQYAESNGDNIKLTFTPNPNFTSHSSCAYVFHKMDGFVILNTKEDRLVEISGRLTNGVEFLGGLLGHLDPGGTFDVRRDQIAPGHWAITRFIVNMNGKMLFFKSINVQQNEIHIGFQRIPDSTTLAQAESIAQQSITATNPTGGGNLASNSWKK